jgi:hypothetical protein
VDPEEISKDILAYLLDHPQAQDTLKGIVEWWLLQQQIQRWAIEVEEVLANLVRQQLVLERKGADHQRHYRLNPRKLQTIRERLEKRVTPTDEPTDAWRLM